MKTVLLIGSAPDAVMARDLDTTRIDHVVAINNAWRIRNDWDHLIFPEDFPEDRRPPCGPGQQCVTADAFVPANNAYGGVVYAGGTMCFTAAYWVLAVLKPDLLLFCGCDMHYNRSRGKSHFYGEGTADPLRRDPTLQSLEAKATRLMLLAARQDCLCANLGRLPDSRLVFPRIAAAELSNDLYHYRDEKLAMINAIFDPAKIHAALAEEKALNCLVPDGKYWAPGIDLDAGALFSIDMMWRGASYSRADTKRRSAR